MPDVDCIGSLSTQLVYLSLKEHILTLFKSSSAAPPKPIFEHRSLEPGLNNPARCRVVVAVVLWCCGAVVRGPLLWVVPQYGKLTQVLLRDCGGLRWSAHQQPAAVADGSWQREHLGAVFCHIYCYIYCHIYCYIYCYLLWSENTRPQVAAMCKVMSLQR